MTYAAKTTVSIERSQGEIRKTLQKYKSTGVMTAEANNCATVVFEMNSKRIKFSFELAVYQKTMNKNRLLMSRNQIDQENRRLWRCLLLAIKSKLECVESGITSFEQEFMAHILLPNGQTMSEFALPQIEDAYKAGSMPPLLGFSK